MKNQMRVLSPSIFSILFFVLLVSCVSSSNVEAPSNSSSLDIYTFSFFPFFPPFVCQSAQDNSLQQPNDAFFNLQTRNYDAVAKSIFGPDSPFNRVADFPPDDSLRGTTQDVNFEDLVQHASKVLFGRSIEQFRNSSTFLNEGAPNGSMCTAAMAGRGECGTDVVGDGITSPGARRVKGPDDVLACVLTEIQKSAKYPENVGSILCYCSRLFPTPDSICPFVSFLSQTMACTQSFNCTQKDPKPYVPPEDPRYANLPMEATLPTPTLLPQKVIDSEIQTYYLLAKSTALLSYDVEQAACDPLYNSSSTLPGWDTVMTVNLVERKAGKPGASVPFARLTSRPNKDKKNLNDFLITVRGTTTPGEWGVDFSYNKVLVQLTPTDLIPIHRGFASVASAAWGPLQLELQKAFDNGSLGTITITGHSLGGGVAAVLGAFAHKQFGMYLPNCISNPRVRVVTFGAGRSGGLDFASFLSKVVVMRTIEADFDPVPQIPCTTMVGCTTDLAPVPTARNATTVFTYSDGFGVVHVTNDDLPDGFSQNATNLKFVAWHNCAYDCWTSFKADPTHLALCLPPSPANQTGPQVCSALA